MGIIVSTSIIFHVLLTFDFYFNSFNAEGLSTAMWSVLLLLILYGIFVSSALGIFQVLKISFKI
jgi:hypothetical protein